MVSKTIVGAAVGGTVLAALVAVALAKPSGSPKQAANAVDSGKMPTVQLVSAKNVLTAGHEEITGTLYPAQALQLGFEVQGRLWKVLVKKGDRVAAGQLLAQLDPETADAQVAQWEASVGAAEAAADMAKDVAGRNEKLSKEGSVSELASKNASATARQAESELMGAKAQLAQARTTRRRQDLKAPFAATVIDAPEQVGTTVAVGAPLFTLEQLDNLILKTTVSETARAELTVGQPVKVTSATTAASSDAATIRLILPSADSATRRIPVEITVPNADGRFAAHTLVRATLTLGAPAPAQTIPATALVAAGGDHVFVVGPHGAVQRLAVKVIERGATDAVVRADVPLTQVIDDPAADLTEGALVSSR